MLRNVRVCVCDYVCAPSLSPFSPQIPHYFFIKASKTVCVCVCSLALSLRPCLPASLLPGFLIVSLLKTLRNVCVCVFVLPHSPTFPITSLSNQ